MGFGAYTLAGGGAKIGEHPTDLDTLAYWSLDGTGTDTGGGANNITGTIAYSNVNGLATAQRCGYSTNGYTTTSTGLKIAGSITIAMWFCRQSDAGSNLSLCGIRASGGSGNPNTHNFPWSLDLMSDQKWRMIWQHDNKVTPEIVSPAVLPLNEWHHLAATRNSAGTAGEIFLDGVSVNTGSGFSAWNGGASVNNVRFLNNGAGTEVRGSFSSVIVKDVTIDAAGALALYRSALVV